MKTQLTNYSICILLVILWSCSKKQAEQKELVLHSNYDQIQDIVSIADCDSPFGKYITEVHSLTDGSCYFFQKFADNNVPFIVKVNADNKGHIINEQDVILDTLSTEDVEMIRGHEIHKMSIDPWFFFEDITYEKQLKYLGTESELYNGKDNLDNPVEIVYNRRKKLISKIALLNPKDTLQTIEILYDKWVQSNYGKMLKEIKIVQAKKDTFYFDFRSLKVSDESGGNNIIDL